jgi:hypothetical protein
MKMIDVVDAAVEPTDMIRIGIDADQQSINLASHVLVLATHVLDQEPSTKKRSGAGQEGAMREVGSGANDRDLPHPHQFGDVTL